MENLPANPARTPQHSPSRLPFVSAFCALLVVFWVVPTDAQIATLTAIRGRVTAKDTSTAPWLIAQLGGSLSPQGAVKTDVDSQAGIQFRSGVYVRVNELSVLNLGASGAAIPTLTLPQGELYVVSRASREIPEISTPLVSASIRGTEFGVVSTPERTEISVIDGAVEATNRQGSILARNGERIIVLRGQAPTKEILLRPLNAVQWTLHIPAVVAVEDFDEAARGFSAEDLAAWAHLKEFNPQAASQNFAGVGWQYTLARAIRLYQGGDLTGALSEARSNKGEAGAPLLVFRIGLLLSAGKVVDAQTELGRAARVALSPKIAGLLAAYQALIELAQGDSAKAQQSIARALDRDDISPIVKLAQSYILQAQFDLAPALAAAEVARTRSPANPLAIARVVELLLSNGEIERARALLLTYATSSDAHLETVRGFAQMIENNFSTAEKSFAHAHALDPMLPLPALGAGLIRIRKGDLAEGRLQIQQAVAFSPGSSLLRSYLGKAFFEENDFARADNELQVAAALDPLDPTPLLYKAYSLDAQNRPVAALAALEDSFALNGNRAVYRSRFQLDEDRAVRGLGLAQIYQQLGFQQIAREEAIKSIGSDYTNYSAHLMLALLNSEQVDRLASSALAEFYTAQILSPRGFNILNDSQANSAASLNEYSSLFERDRTRFNVSGSHTTNIKSSALDTTAFGNTEKFSYLLNYSTEYSAGYRSNDFDRQNTVVGRAQWEPQYGTSLNSTTIWTGQANGDDDPTFDPQATDPDKLERLKVFAQQVGVNQRLSPMTTLLAQAVYQHTRTDIFDDAVVKTFLLSALNHGELLGANFASVLTDRGDLKIFDAYRADSQMISKFSGGSILWGVGFTRGASKYRDLGEISSAEQIFLRPEFTLNSGSEKDQQLFRGYTYGRYQLFEPLIFEAGAQYANLRYNDRFAPPYQDELQRTSRVSPKVGLLYSPTPSLFFRAAYFHQLAGLAVSEIGDIEPTTVGGFNQSITETPGTRARNYGISGAFKIAANTYLGSEYLFRQISRDLNIGLDGVAVEITNGTLERRSAGDRFNFSSNERMVRSYINHVFSESTVASLSHTYSTFSDGLFSVEGKGIGTRRTHELMSEIAYFDRSGFFGRIGVGYDHQDLEGYGGVAPEVRDGTRSFWLTRAALDYRLPRRAGTISLKIENAFDRGFLFIPSQLSPTIIPDRTVTVAFSLTF